MKKIICVLLVLCTVFLCSCEMMFFMVTMFAYDANLEEPPPPKITYGEFDFEVVYKLNDEILTVKDTLICEYAGVKNINAMPSWYEYEWNGRTKSGQKGSIYVVLYSSETEEGTVEVCFLPLAREGYLMGTSQQDDIYSIVQPLLIRRSNGDYVDKDYITCDEAWEQYRVRVLEIKWDPPIVNEFEEAVQDE